MHPVRVLRQLLRIPNGSIEACRLCLFMIHLVFAFTPKTQRV